MARNVDGELTVISYKFGELKYAKSVLCFLTKVLAEMIELALQFNLISHLFIKLAYLLYYLKYCNGFHCPCL